MVVGIPNDLLRRRPDIRSADAFILGVVPLLFADGAGAASQSAIGTTVFGGRLASTLLAISFVPVFYVFMQRLTERGRRPETVMQKKDPIVDKGIE